MKTSKLLLLALVAFSLNNTVLNAQVCNDKESCLTDPSCQCYCSVKCGYRDKKPGIDNPVYIEEGIDGIHCFCKETDLREFESGVCRKPGKISPRLMQENPKEHERSRHWNQRGTRRAMSY